MTETESVGWMRKIEDLDRRFIYIILIVLIILPTMVPGIIPVTISTLQPTQEFYDIVQSLTPGTKVLYDMSVGNIYVEQGSGALAIVRSLFTKKVDLYVVTFSNVGPPFIDDCIQNRLSASEKEGMVYGVNYVQLGYVAGLETGMAAFNKNIRLLGTDYFGNDLATLPIMEGMNQYTDFDLFVFIGTQGDYVFRQMYGPYPQIPIIGAWHAAHLPTYEPYYKAGIVKGYLGATTGFAQYEQLIGRPGLATAYLSAINATNWCVVLLIILGNVLYLTRRFLLGGKT